MMIFIPPGLLLTICGHGFERQVTELTCFSVIVPVFNGTETLDKCLIALTNQDYPKDKFEVIVVNDGSTDHTAEIASCYPVYLINLETNQGRVTARNTGARAARHETLVFNDVRICPYETLLADINRYNYQPLMPDVKVYNGSKQGFSRFFYLLRRKIYAPYYPLSEIGADFYITQENFDKIPKGTGLFVVNRTIWLAAQPETSDKTTSDDTRILRQIVEHKSILRTASISVDYKERTKFNKVIPHIFQRGPLFADYYLHPGGRHYWLYLSIWLLLGGIILGIWLQPQAWFWGSAALLLLGLSFAALYLSETWTDMLVVAAYLPIIVSAFGLGILKWQIIQWVKLFKLS